MRGHPGDRVLPDVPFYGLTFLSFLITIKRKKKERKKKEKKKEKERRQDADI